MSIQRVSLEALQKIRHHLKSALVMPEIENHPNLYANKDQHPAPEFLNELGSLFHFGSSIETAFQMPNDQGQWFISASNPGTALLKLPGVRLKSGFRLVSYLYRMGNDGTGCTYAIPEQFSTTAHLEKALITANGRDTPPKPEGALNDFMEALEGDRSATSFVIASLLRRELHEVGKIGRSLSWTHHRLIDTIPAQLNWHWCIETPKDISPKVRLSIDGQVAIEFFTCCTVAPIAIFQHVDFYVPGQYRAKCLSRAIAQIPPNLIRSSQSA